jgi:hypothetical protein
MIVFVYACDDEIFVCIYMCYDCLFVFIGMSYGALHQKYICGMLMRIMSIIFCMPTNLF